MASTKYDNPRLYDPVVSGLGGLLTEMLNPVVDVARDVEVRLGAKPYQVSLVWAAWAGGQRNFGLLNVVEVVRLLPTPQTTPERTRASIQQPGVVEEGIVSITEISPRYSELVLVGRDVVVDPGLALPEHYDFWYEIEFAQPGQPLPEHRRYTVLGPPTRSVKTAGWSIDVKRATAVGRIAGDRT